MDSLERLQKTSISLASGQWGLQDPRWRHNWDYTQATAGINLSGLEPRQKRGFDDIFSRSWFKRAWILQEVANAQSCVVQCGERSVRAHFLALAPVLWGRSVDPHCQAVLDIMPGPSRKSSWWSSRHDLYMLLTKFQEAQATDPRDRIYALLGMSSDWGLAGGILPDYTKTSSELREDICNFLFFGLLDPNSVETRSIEHVLASFQWLNLAAMRQYMTTLQTSQLASAIRLARRRNGIKEEDMWTLITEALPKQGSNHQVARMIFTILLSASVHADDENQHLTPNQKYTSTFAFLHEDRRIQQFIREVDLDLNRNDGTTLAGLLPPLDESRWMILKLLMSSKNSIRARDMHGRTALSHAAARGLSGLVRTLLKQGFVVDSQDLAGRTPLSWASINGHQDAAWELISNDANVNVPDNEGMTPLSHAAYFGREMVSFLLNKGSHPDHVDSHGMTPLCHAVWNGHEDAVREMLLSCLVDPTMNPGLAARTGKTPKFPNDSISWLLRKLWTPQTREGERLPEPSMPLVEALKAGKHATAYLLVAAGAHPGSIGLDMDFSNALEIGRGIVWPAGSVKGKVERVFWDEYHG